MILQFADYPKLTVEDAKKQNANFYNNSYNKYNKQNDKEVIKCFLNSLNKELCKHILTRSEDNMKFSKVVFMTFIKHKKTSTQKTVQ